jgi:hypothetical protein
MAGDKPNAATTIIPITAIAHFPIKLTISNFLVRRKEIQSTLIGVDLDKFRDGSLSTPLQFIDTKNEDPRFPPLVPSRSNHLECHPW